jgi:hypothetical protein
LVARKKKNLVGRKAHQHEPRPQNVKRIEEKEKKKTIIQLVLNFNRGVADAAAALPLHQRVVASIR